MNYGMQAMGNGKYSTVCEFARDSLLYKFICATKTMKKDCVTEFTTYFFVSIKQLCNVE